MLKMCHIRGVVIELESVDIQVAMTELRELYVGELNVLDFFTASKLQSLAIADNYLAVKYSPTMSRRSVPRIARFLRRSRCQLQSLNMHMKIFQSESSALISGVLSSDACSTISHLTFKLGSQLKKVSNTLDSSWVLPNLRHLVISMEHHYFGTGKTKRLVDMVRSRRDTTLLKSIKVQLGHSYHHHRGSDEDEDEGEDMDRTETDMEVGIRALAGEKFEVQVEKCDLVDKAVQSLFWDGEIFRCY
ncbi:hypothetical protein EDD18DRAFT_1166438 [Armillaria luteobubalina]|uniref:Uncharacterized protein n=1 Tax=Armillaria luteobubalina TaxID=153913 RepID=A0AA39UP48_9AGAR|nr:hypothetical protein EDD18DRAFT_1166438 [Armillaria luteobubalina]